MEDFVHDFSDLLTGHQQRLYRYIVSLLGNAEAAWGVLQETNRVLLEMRGRFEPGTSFANWALTVAQYQTMAWLRDQSRDRLVATPEVVELLATESPVKDALDDERASALLQCVQTLSQTHRELLHHRYARSQSLAELSVQSGRSTNALKQLFFRIRQTLLDCVQRRLEAETT
jgi:RNA polymerase sigma-70 factor (ECF subfamily)